MENISSQELALKVGLDFGGTWYNSQKEHWIGWLGEAAGIPATKIRHAFDAVIDIRTSRMASHCRAIRQIIPWEDVAKSLAQLPAVSHDVQEMHSRETLTAGDRLRARVYKKEVYLVTL